MNPTYTYVDNSNVFIEGQRISAVQKGMAYNVNDAIDRHIFDYTWQIDYGKLHNFICGDRRFIKRAKLWGSPPPGDSFWEMVERKGFEVERFERSLSGKEKKVDVAIAHQMTKDAYLLSPEERDDAEFTLVAGDKDFVPVVQDLTRSLGIRVDVVFWSHAARELVDVSTNFIKLDDYINNIELMRS